MDGRGHRSRAFPPGTGTPIPRSPHRRSWRRSVASSPWPSGPSSTASPSAAATERPPRTVAATAPPAAPAISFSTPRRVSPVGASSTRSASAAITASNRARRSVSAALAAREAGQLGFQRVRRGRRLHAFVLPDRQSRRRLLHQRVEKCLLALVVGGRVLRVPLHGDHPPRRCRARRHGRRRRRCCPPWSGRRRVGRSTGGARNGSGRAAPHPRRWRAAIRRRSPPRGAASGAPHRCAGATCRRARRSSTCSPRQIASTGRSRRSASLATASSTSSCTADTPYDSLVGGCAVAAGVDVAAAVEHDGIDSVEQRHRLGDGPGDRGAITPAPPAREIVSR